MKLHKAEHGGRNGERDELSKGGDQTMKNVKNLIEAERSNAPHTQRSLH